MKTRRKKTYHLFRMSLYGFAVEPIRIGDYETYEQAEAALRQVKQPGDHFEITVC